MLSENQSNVIQNHPAFKLQLACLLAAGVMEFLFLVFGYLFHSISFYYVESYLIIPCAVFLGVTLTQKIAPGTRRQLMLCMGMVAWFVITQSIHKLQGMDLKSISMFFCVYLLSFPFASLTDDGVRQAGLKGIAWIFLGVSMTLIFYSLLLILDLVPSCMEQYIYWDGSRLLAMWHPNICACLFMIGIALSIGFSFQFPKVWQKGLMLTAAALQFICLALTNGRTSILMTCFLLGGILFFTFRSRNWNWLLGILAAVLAMAMLFAVSNIVYKANTQRLIEAKAAMNSAPQVQSETASQEKTQETVQDAVQEETVKLHGNNGQGTLLNDLKTMNGRKMIWTAAFKALRDNPSLLIWGTEYPDVIVSVYTSFPVEHTHNSWIQILFLMGLPGLIIVLIVTGITVWSGLRLLWKNDDLWKTCIVLLGLCILVSGVMEPFLFSADIAYHYFDFFFLLCSGYIIQWQRQSGSVASETEKRT